MDNTTPSAARSMPEALEIPCDAKRIASTSKPSSAFGPSLGAALVTSGATLETHDQGVRARQVINRLLETQ